MKKNTNKILWITAIIAAALVIISITVDFQIDYHKNPEGFKIKPVESTIVIEDATLPTQAEDTL